MKKVFYICLSIILSLCIFTGCSESSGLDKALQDTTTLIEESTSVDTSIYVEMNAKASSSSNKHNVSLLSDIAITSTRNPIAYHAELFSRITVDDVMSKEDQEFYIVPDNDEYLKYTYMSDTEEWEMYEMPVKEVLDLPTKTGIDFDWHTLLANASNESDSENINDIDCSMFEGEIDSSILQYIFGNEIFNSFMYSVEMLLSDNIPFVLYISNETGYPVQLSFDLTDCFIVSDMDFETATVTVTYDNWNAVTEISVPKKVSVVAIEPVKNLYNSFYAWNLFLPYVNGTGGNSISGNSGSTFQSIWDTYQFRLDDCLAQLPITYEDLLKLGYKIDSNQDDILVDPNQYVDKIAIFKGEDKLYCALYNDTTSALPITSCKIGSIDLSTTNNNNNSITLYLPGEIKLGMEEEAIVAAYGKPDSKETTFAADLYTWKGEDEQHCLIAEISPATKQVIRIYLKCIPVYGNK